MSINKGMVLIVVEAELSIVRLAKGGGIVRAQAPLLIISLLAYFRILGFFMSCILQCGHVKCPITAAKVYICFNLTKFSHKFFKYFQNLYIGRWQ